MLKCSDRIHDELVEYALTLLFVLIGSGFYALVVIPTTRSSAGEQSESALGVSAVV